MNAKLSRKLRASEQLRNRLAKYMALTCFRNTELENLHAGTSPSSVSGDFSDVRVVTPYGEILWTQLSRFDDDEMKKLMQEVVWRCYVFLMQFLDEGAAAKLLQLLETYDPASAWDDPFPPEHVVAEAFPKEPQSQSD